MYFEGAKKQACNYAENVLLQMFFQEPDQNLQNSYFIKLSLMHVTLNPVEYSPGGVFNPLILVVTKGHTYILKQTWKSQLKVCLTCMIKKGERGIEHTNLLIYLER